MAGLAGEAPARGGGGRPGEWPESHGGDHADARGAAGPGA